jgi:transposase
LTCACKAAFWRSLFLLYDRPERFKTKFKLFKYARLSITDRSSDGTPLGYQRLDRAGNRELRTFPIMLATGRVRPLADLADGLQIDDRSQCDQELLPS